ELLGILLATGGTADAVEGPLARAERTDEEPLGAVPPGAPPAADPGRAAAEGAAPEAGLRRRAETACCQHLGVRAQQRARQVVVTAGAALVPPRAQAGP